MLTLEFDNVAGDELYVYGMYDHHGDRRNENLVMCHPHVGTQGN